MKYNNKIFSLCVLSACILFLSVAGCATGDDDDDDNDEADELAACIPENASAEDREVALEILAFYVGDYEDDAGRKRTLACDPDGEWQWPENYDPEAGIIYSYLIPVAVTFADEEVTGDGFLQVDFDPAKLSAGKRINEWPASFETQFEQQWFEFHRTSEWDDSPLVFRLSTDSPPDEGWRHWTKLD